MPQVTAILRTVGVRVIFQNVCRARTVPGCGLLRLRKLDVLSEYFRAMISLKFGTTSHRFECIASRRLETDRVLAIGDRTCLRRNTRASRLLQLVNAGLSL